MNKQDIKRYLVSSLVTFIATFLLVFLPQVSDLSWEAITGGAVLGLLVTALRAAVKAGIEILIPYIQSLLVK